MMSKKRRDSGKRRESARAQRPWRRNALAFSSLVAAIVAVSFFPGPPKARAKSEGGVMVAGTSDARAPSFVGAAACASCHGRENALWRGSHHQLAMQQATDQTVLGAFNNVSFTSEAITSTFFRAGSKFMVR